MLSFHRPGPLEEGAGTTKAPVLRLCEVEVYAYSYCKNHSLNLLFLEKKRENLVERDKMRENEKGQN